MIKAFILAGNYNQYNHFIEENYLEKREYPYIGEDTDRMKGIENFDIIRVGDWYNRPKRMRDEIHLIWRAMQRRR